MASVNKVILVGNLGRDPEVRYLPSGEQVTNITLATSSKYKSKTGEMVEETEWHRVAFFNKLAEIAGQYLRKGRSVYIEGRIKTRKYTDKDGIEKYATDIIASEMQMLGSRDSAGDPSGDSSSAAYDSAPRRTAPAPTPAAPARPAPARQAPEATAPPEFDEDIPF